MKKGKVIVGILLTCISIAFIGSFMRFNTSAEEAKIVGCDIETSYKRGDEFEMPDGKVSYKGTEKDAEQKYIVFPSGKANVNEKVILSEDGKYEIVFQAEIDGVTVSAKESFIVNKSVLSVNSADSSAHIEDGKIHVDLAINDIFTYNEALDLSTATKDVPLINMNFTPYKVGTPDAKYVMIRFTDLYDENNYFTIRMINHGGEWASGVTYLSVGAANQPQVGVENVGDDPTQNKVYTDVDFGAAVYFSTSGLPNSEQDTQLKIYFDYAEKAFYVDREIYSGGQNRMIVDLDNKEHFGTELWDGFTTGEVKMSIYAENYQAASCNFSISTINGSSQFEDTGDQEGPIVLVDTEYELDKLPTALVGKPYTLFQSNAVDVYDGDVETVASVYYKYYSEDPMKISVNDGQFTPTKEGTYVIEYSATDCTGNVGTKCINVKAEKGNGLQIQLKGTATETNTGVPVKVFSDLKYKTPSGNTDYSVVAVNKSSGEEVQINKKTLEFLPMSDGEWEITVTVQDYVSTVQETFSVNANHTTQPQVYDTVALPKYFIKDATYNMPKLLGYDFSSGVGIATDMDILVKEKGSKEVAIDNGQYTPSKTGKAEIIYRLTVDGKVCEKVYTVSVVEVGYAGDLDISKYFVASKGNVTAESTTTNIVYNMKADAMLEFVNLVQVKNLTFAFQVGKKNAYEKVNVYLTDAMTGKQVKISYQNTKAGAVFSVNDGPTLGLQSSFDGADRNFSLAYNNDTHTVEASANAVFDIDKYLDGSEFKGFTDSIALFAIEAEGVSGASQLILKNLNAHTLNNTRVDRFAPVALLKTNSGDRGVGEKIELKIPFVYDTLDPIATIALEVTDPNGSYIKDEEGVVLDGTQNPFQDYTIRLDAFGDYTIKYVYTDGKGRSDEYVYAITSKDITGPMLTLKKHKESAKEGATVKVAETETKDDVTKECNVAVYVFNPEGVFVEVKDGKFEALMTGTYTVRYMACDESGNYAFASYEVDVK